MTDEQMREIALDSIVAAIAEAVAIETERCKKICERLTGRSYEFDMGRISCADEITSTR